MKKLLLMLGKTLGLASAITLFAAVSSANAVVIDFTTSPLSSSGTTGGIGWTLSVYTGPGSLTLANGSAGSTCAGTLGLACLNDGVGIGDDEITAFNSTSGQVLKLAFDNPVDVSQIMFLDLYVGNAAEQASVGTDGLTYGLTFLATEGAGTSGAFLANGVGLTGIDALYFTAFLPNLDDNSNDYALAGVNVALSRIPVPLPASLPLFASGLGALGFLRWRKDKKARRAA
jgi:hypothetical protein